MALVKVKKRAPIHKPKWHTVSVGYWPPGWSVVFEERFRDKTMPPRLPVMASLIIEEAGGRRKTVPGVLWDGELIPAQDVCWVEALLSPNGLPYYPADNQ